MLVIGKYTPLYEKGIKQNQNKPMETTTRMEDRNMQIFANARPNTPARRVFIAKLSKSCNTS